MSSFIIPVKDSYGNTVYFKTSPHKGEDTIKNYESVVIWLEKNGFRVNKDVSPAPEQPSPATTVPQEHHCVTCGQLMTYREGTGKTGKPYKGYFCPERGHEPQWVK